MASFMDMIRGLQTQSQNPTNFLDLLGVRQAEAEGEPIVVTGGRPTADPRMTSEAPSYNEPPIRERIDPRYVLNDDRQPPTPEELEEIVPRKGMFGVKGTLRDVLGTLGDAFLVQSGNNPVYAPRRQAEKEGDALFGYTQNPTQAIERLSIHNPKMAAELNEAYQQQLLRQAQQESLDANRESLIKDREFGNYEIGLDRLSRWVRGRLPYERLVAGAAQYGISEDDLAALGVSPDMTDEDRAAFAAGDMTVNQQELLPRRDRQLDISQQNADSSRMNAQSSRIRANKAGSSSSRPRADTELEYYRAIQGKRPEDRTPGENAFVKKYLEGTRGNQSNNQSVPGSRSAASGASSRFRPVR